MGLTFARLGLVLWLLAACTPPGDIPSAEPTLEAPPIASATLVPTESAELRAERIAREYLRTMRGSFSGGTPGVSQIDHLPAQAIPSKLGWLVLFSDPMLGEQSAYGVCVERATWTVRDDRVAATKIDSHRPPSTSFCDPPFSVRGADGKVQMITATPASTAEALLLALPTATQVPQARSARCLEASPVPPRPSVDSSPEDVAQFIVAALYSSCEIPSGAPKPEVLLARRVTVPEVEELGSAKSSLCADEPLALVILRGDLWPTKGRPATYPPEAPQWFRGYAAVVWPLRPSGPLIWIHSADGSAFKQVLTDPRLPHPHPTATISPADRNFPTPVPKALLDPCQTPPPVVSPSPLSAQSNSGLYPNSRFVGYDPNVRHPPRTKPIGAQSLV